MQQNLQAHLVPVVSQEKPVRRQREIHLPPLRPGLVQFEEELKEPHEEGTRIRSEIINVAFLFQATSTTYAANAKNPTDT